MSAQPSSPVIRASELGQHAYCARSWWLERVQGIPSANVRELASGVAAHRAHGRAVVRYHSLQKLAYALLLLALCVGVMAVVALVRGGR
jgi:hypothetical protein